jgi:hypothetical protein
MEYLVAPIQSPSNKNRGRRAPPPSQHIFDFAGTWTRLSRIFLGKSRLNQVNCADLKKGAAADARLQLMTMAAVTADAVVSDSRPDHDST